MSHAGTLWLGYGITIAAVLGYAAWLRSRSSALGSRLGIGKKQTTGKP